MLLQLELIAVKLAGRGKRICDEPYEDVPQAIEDVFQQVKEKIQESPYALFGHSMGGMIAPGILCN